MTIRHSALLAIRSPPRFSRCRLVLPEEAGSGATPYSLAKAASLDNRSGLSPAATGLGGPCFGDSGSPHLLPGSVTTIGVTKAVLGNCHTAVPVTLVDTPEARSFLAAFVTVS